MQDRVQGKRCRWLTAWASHPRDGNPLLTTLQGPLTLWWSLGRPEMPACTSSRSNMQPVKGSAHIFDYLTNRISRLATLEASKLQFGGLRVADCSSHGNGQLHSQHYLDLLNLPSPKKHPRKSKLDWAPRCIGEGASCWHQPGPVRRILVNMACRAL